MTFNEIQKEFDEEFVRDTGLMRVTPYSSSELPMADAIKSFLKQSFIKYLQSQIEYNKEKAQTFCGEYNDEKGIRAMCYLEFLEDQIIHITNQIKELEV